MNIYFLDSSALAKRYLAETGADWVRALATPSAQTLLTFLVADTHLATIAQAEGLQTDNPNLH